MTQQQRQARIRWFYLRTGCTQEEAKKWLTEGDWKMDKAINLRRDYYKQLHS